MFNTVIEGTPISYCLQLISKYIYEKKGVLVQIQSPITPKQEELFIKALNISCAYYGIEI